MFESSLGEERWFFLPRPNKNKGKGYGMKKKAMLGKCAKGPGFHPQYDIRNKTTGLGVVAVPAIPEHGR